MNLGASVNLGVVGGWKVLQAAGEKGQQVLQTNGQVKQGQRGETQTPHQAFVGREQAQKCLRWDDLAQLRPSLLAATTDFSLAPQETCFSETPLPL